MANAKPKVKKKASLWQVISLVVLLLLLMITSVITSLMAVGIINVLPQSGQSINSMTDAQLLCDNEIKNEHAENLRSFFVDDHSSHYDQNSGRYKMFYELELHRSPNKSSGVTKFYMNCFVTSGGRIRNLDLFEEKTYTPKAVRRSKGNAFGL